MSKLEVGLDTSISVQVGVVTELEIERDVTGSASVAQEMESNSADDDGVPGDTGNGESRACVTRISQYWKYITIHFLKLEGEGIIWNINLQTMK